MLIALFSDLHAHPFKPYATVLPNGMNSRLADAIACIDQILAICLREGVQLALFGGDLFHVRRTINVQAFNAVYEALAKFRLAGIPVALIHGNHDQADKAGDDHSIHAFRTFLTVIDKPGWQVIPGNDGQLLSVMAVPYTENVEHLRSLVQEPCPEPGTSKIFLGHFGVQGAKVGADFVYTNPHDAAIDDLNQGAFDAGFLGHYHLRQAVGRWCYIGAPLQHNWGDTGQDRGFLLYDTEQNVILSRPLLSPKFIKITSDDLEGRSATDVEYLCGGNFVRVIDDMPWSEDAREATREGMGARSLEVIPPSIGSKPAEGPRLEIRPGMSMQDIVSTYVRRRAGASALDEDYLLQLGMEIMEEVENASS